MKRVDYINQEAIMCFPTPKLDIDILKQNKVEFHKGDFVNFNKKSTVPISTYFYKYKENLLIMDIDRQNPIVHIIRNSKVKDTIRLKDLRKDDMLFVEQIIDIHGNEIKCNSLAEIDLFYNEFKKYKHNYKNTYKESRNKLEELIISSDKMKRLDKIAGTIKVIDFINNDNFKNIKFKLSNIYNCREVDVEIYKEGLKKLNNFTSLAIISDVLEKEFYQEFRMKNKEHIESLTLANKKANTLSEEFNTTWYSKDIYIKEKKLGAIYDCFNEMFYSELYSNKDIEIVEDIISNILNEDSELLDSFIEWVGLCPIEKDEMREVLTEIVKNNKAKKIQSLSKL